MNLRDLQRNWNRMGAEDPLWAVSTAPEYKNGKWSTDEFFATGREQLAAVFDHAESLGLSSDLTGKALDFGCGVGRLSQALAAKFDEVVGVDIAQSMIDQAREFNEHGGRVQYVLNEQDDLSVFPDDTFDFVYSEIVLMHMEPRYSLAYMREFLRVVKPGGIVSFQIPEPTPRQELREKLPRWLVYTGNKVRTLRAPMMEIYGVYVPQVVTELAACQGERVDVQNYEAAGRDDHRYWFRKTRDL